MPLDQYPEIGIVPYAFDNFLYLILPALINRRCPASECYRAYFQAPPNRKAEPFAVDICAKRLFRDCLQLPPPACVPPPYNEAMKAELITV
jgi:hypothetical protein